ncbi:D-isomer specific 2-hydroxyacid dehydrogenase [Trypanosoma melophagium]|uniref:D-isomer specific 2-hydroxyacid dehydrogenase n=1 Tax=Trypanosoma melophagium TaxID=715481 RepID=UPI00351A6224|nr:D-isomer specific 2-hydroxyacid dehydrogenase [Trypanosoma melophagium]
MRTDLSQCTLCVAFDLSREKINKFANYVSQNVGVKRIVQSSEDPVKDLKDAKLSNEPIILIIAGAIGHDAIEYLCDDYNLPKEQRRVRWIHSLSSGLDAYRLDELTKELKDIPFTNARGCYSPILAEHVIYSMLYFNRQTWRLLASRAEHKWDPFNMIELRGQKMGIIGYGDIGHATAKLAVTMGMEVTGVKRSAPTANVDEYGVHVVHGDAARDRVLRESDFVVNILPGTEETREFFNKERFALMKPSAIYINIGRGLTQNEEHLACALRDGVIAGAAVDVFTKEPFPPESPLWNIGDDKLLMTNHSALLSDRFEDKIAGWFLKCFKIFGTPEFEARRIRFS